MITIEKDKCWSPYNMEDFKEELIYCESDAALEQDAKRGSGASFSRAIQDSPECLPVWTIVENLF